MWCVREKAKEPVRLGTERGDWKVVADGVGEKNRVLPESGQTSVLAGIQTGDSHGSNRCGGIRRQKVLRRRLLDLE